MFMAELLTVVLISFHLADPIPSIEEIVKNEQAIMASRTDGRDWMIFADVIIASRKTQSKEIRLHTQVDISGNKYRIQVSTDDRKDPQWNYIIINDGYKVANMRTEVDEDPFATRTVAIKYSDNVSRGRFDVRVLGTNSADFFSQKIYYTNMYFLRFRSQYRTVNRIEDGQDTIEVDLSTDGFKSRKYHISPLQGMNVILCETKVGDDIYRMECTNKLWERGNVWFPEHVCTQESHSKYESKCEVFVLDLAVEKDFCLGRFELASMNIPLGALVDEKGLGRENQALYWDGATIREGVFNR